MVNRTSPAGIKLIEAREGIILHGYLDSKRLLTIGCGHLVKKGEPYKLNQPITQAECDRLLAQDLGEVENVLNQAVKVPINQNQFDALVSLGFNIGADRLRKSSAVRKLNQKDYDGAAKAILLWNKPPEIKGRRNGEYKQFITKVSAPSQPPVSATPAPSLQEPIADADEPKTPALDPTLPTNQIADTIVNNGSQPLATQSVELTAPQGMGSVATSTKVTIAGITVPAVFVALFQSIQDLVAKGYIDAKDIGTAVLTFIQSNTKYFFILVGLVIAVIVVKKLSREFIFALSVYSHARPDWNSVTITAPDKVQRKWWQIWK